MEDNKLSKFKLLNLIIEQFKEVISSNNLN
jgi:hypothetical protein